MSFQFSPRSLDLQARLKAFMDQHIYPNEHRFEEEVAANRRAGNVWVPTRLIDELKPAARDALEPVSATLGACARRPVQP